MTSSTGKIDPGAQARQRGRWADVGLAVCAISVGVVSWVYLERTENIGPSAAVFLLAFCALGLLASLSHRISTTGSKAAVPRRTPLSAPRWGVWLVPVALYPVLAVTFPIGYRTHPGDDSIWAAAAAFVIVLGYGGLLIGVLLWAWLGSRLFTATRDLVVWRREHGFDEVVWICVFIVGTFACFATYLVAFWYAPKRDSTLRGPDIATSDLLGWGSEGNAASLWVIRAALLGGLLCLLGIVLMIGRMAHHGRKKG